MIKEAKNFIHEVEKNGGQVKGIKETKTYTIVITIWNNEEYKEIFKRP